MKGARAHSKGPRTVPSGRTTCEAGGMPSTYASSTSGYRETAEISYFDIESSPGCAVTDLFRFPIFLSAFPFPQYNLSRKPVHTPGPIPSFINHSTTLGFVTPKPPASSLFLPNILPLPNSVPQFSLHPQSRLIFFSCHHTAQPTALVIPPRWQVALAILPLLGPVSLPSPLPPWAVKPLVV